MASTKPPRTGTDVEASSADIKEATPVTSPVSPTSTAFYPPTPRRATVLAIGLVLIMLLSVCIGGPNLDGQPVMFEVVPIDIDLFPGFARILTVLIISLPHASIQVWLQQAMFACGFPGRPLRWRRVVVFVFVFVLGTTAMKCCINAFKEELGVSKMDVLGLWKEKECFVYHVYHGTTWCQRQLGEEKLEGVVCLRWDGMNVKVRLK